MTAAQNNFDIGYKAVETIVKILNGEEYGDVDTGTEIITKDNAQDVYKRQPRDQAGGLLAVRSVHHALPDRRSARTR